MKELRGALAKAFSLEWVDRLQIEYFNQKYGEWVLLGEDLQVLEDGMKVRLIDSVKDEKLLSVLYYWMSLALKLQAVSYGKSGNYDSSVLWVS